MQRTEDNEVVKIRWVVLAHSSCEKEIESFVKSKNAALKHQNVCFELVKTTAPTLTSLLFRNNNTDRDSMNTCKPSQCYICSNDARGDSKEVKSSANGATYKIDARTTCGNSGIYCITCKCWEQYSGKTTVMYCKRHKEHWTKNTTVTEHLNKCEERPNINEVKIQFLENMWNRGKYSLSEREYLWNRRLKGSINIQKTLKAFN